MLFGRLCYCYYFRLSANFTLFPGWFFSTWELPVVTLALSPWTGSCEHWTNSLDASYLPVLNLKMSFGVRGHSPRWTCCFSCPCCSDKSRTKSRSSLTNLLLSRTASQLVSLHWLILVPSSALLSPLPMVGEQPCHNENFQNVIVVHVNFILT